MANDIGTGHDVIDGVIRDTVFLTTAERHTVFVPLVEFVKRLEAMNEMVSRVQD